jgi:hypothetical protein
MLSPANEIVNATPPTGANGALSEILKVWGTNVTVLGFVSLSDLKTWLEVGLVLLSVAFTLWRWRREAKKKD